MGSANQHVLPQKKLEREVLDVGNRLLELPETTDELFILLEEAESVLAKVWQEPSKSMSEALLPVMRALITDKLLRHTDLDIQVAVASCFNEISRITAPTFSYPDDNMKELFKLVLIAFKQLSCESGSNYCRALEILETVARVRTSLMMLDIDSEGLVVEMFQIFLNTIRSNHPSGVFKYMEMIMTLVVEESDEISFELLSPLLDSVRIENKISSPLAWKLGKKIFKSCGTKLQSYLGEAVQTMNLDLDDYAEIVTCICQGTPNGRDVVSNGESESDGVPEINDQNRKVVQSERSTGAPQRKRGRKPNNRLRPEGEYEDIWITGQKNSLDVSSDGQSEEDSALPSEIGKENVQVNFSKKRIDSVNEVSIRQRDRSEKKKRVVNQHKDTDGKEITEKTSSRKHESKDVRGKMMESSMSRPVEGKHPGKGKEKKSRRPRVGYGEELVNSRVMIWWPMDETYYTGTIKAFNPETKKHTILYDDDETEVLNLRKEKWEVFDDDRAPQTQPLQRREAVHSSPAEEPDKTREEKTPKRKKGSLKKQNDGAASSSKKRPKSENHSIMKLGAKRSASDIGAERSAPEIVSVDDKPADETTHERNDGEAHAGREFAP